jgi:Zn-dependent protease with chaperone function
MPNVSAEAEEFWRMWCAGERAVKPTLADCRAVIASNLDADGTIPLPGGRKAWLYLNPWQHQERFKRYIDPKNIREELENDKRSMVERRTLRVMSNMRFLFPPLPAASISYYDRLDPSVQAEVNQLRRYWISLGAFKDQLFWSRLVVVGLLFLPCLLLAGVYICALERVPFTGRWRIILLTAEEEDKISTSLAGTNWYKSVINLLTTPEAPAPPILPLTDWRWGWVQTTLRTLEDGVVAAVAAAEAGVDDTAAGFDGYRPSSTKYPLKPRPRVSSRLHSALPGGDPQSGQEHLELGPPFSLMLLQKDERNAFSYGFGGKGAGGVVVFTGLLDDILAHDQAEEAVAEQQKPTGVFGGLFSSPSPPRKAKRRTEPTEEQTLHLASVLAHEMGHLLLSHHLETLSQQQVLWPSLLGLSMDLIRAFIWPFT